MNRKIVFHYKVITSVVKRRKIQTLSLHNVITITYSSCTNSSSRIERYTASMQTKHSQINWKYANLKNWCMTSHICKSFNLYSTANATFQTIME